MLGNGGSVGVRVVCKECVVVNVNAVIARVRQARGGAGKCWVTVSGGGDNPLTAIVTRRTAGGVWGRHQNGVIVGGQLWGVGRRLNHNR